MKFLMGLTLMVLAHCIDAQNTIVDRALLSTSGSVGNTSSFIFSWTIGELVINQDDPQFLFGFQQSFLEGNTKVDKPQKGINHIFSPNGDLVNENIDLLPNNAVNARLDLYNKWGVNVFSNAHYIDPFDGKDTNSNELIDDVYLYILKYDNQDGEIIQKGLITIKRK